MLGLGWDGGSAVASKEREEVEVTEFDLIH
jgi:hypothetical protein